MADAARPPRLDTPMRRSIARKTPVVAAVTTKGTRRSAPKILQVLPGLAAALISSASAGPRSSIRSRPAWDRLARLNYCPPAGAPQFRWHLAGMTNLSLILSRYAGYIVSAP